jgi:hypothetical protein
MVLPSNIGFWAFILSTFFTFDTLCSLPVSSSRANHWNLRQKNIVFSVKKILEPLQNPESSRWHSAGLCHWTGRVAAWGHAKQPFQGW